MSANLEGQEQPTQEGDTGFVAGAETEAESGNEANRDQTETQADLHQTENLKVVAEGMQELFENASENKMLFSEMLKDEKVKEAIAALVRTCLNLGISLVDFIPAIGDAVSWSADLAKMTKFDVTPDVSKAVAWGSEGLEALTAGVFPSHAIEGTFQFLKDYPRIKEGIERAKEIWQAHQEAVESPQVVEAAEVFAEGVPA